MAPPESAGEFDRISKLSFVDGKMTTALAAGEDFVDDNVAVLLRKVCDEVDAARESFDPEFC